MKKSLKAFTLIELLIVVAIIAILAAIAVPNFLEAQTRSKVSRAKADMRTLATGLESYRIDNNQYPAANPYNVSSRRTGFPNDPPVLERLSTPISYLTSGLIPDPFQAKQRSGTINGTTGASNPSPIPESEKADNALYQYTVAGPAINGQPGPTIINTNGDKAIWYYCTWSTGPDLIRAQIAGTGLLGSSATKEACYAWVYDPTNGTISNGDIYRVGGETTGAPPAAGGTFYSSVTETGK